MTSAILNSGASATDAMIIAVEQHRRGCLEEAARVYRAVLECDARHAGALHLLGVVKLQQGDWRQAIELIGRAIAIQPGDPAFHCNLAEAFRLSGDLPRAAECCRAALALRPADAAALSALGLVSLEQSDPEAAAAHLRAALKIEPRLAVAHNNLGNALRLLGDSAGSIAHFSEAVRLDPNLHLAWSNLGQMCLAAGRLDESLSHCAEAVRLQPASAEAQSNLGNVLQELGRLTEAKVCYAESLRLQPELAVVCDNLGQVFQREGDLLAAIEWYEAALLRNPQSAMFHAHHAAALHLAGRQSDAVCAFQKALEIDSACLEAGLGLASLRHAEGDCESAATLYRAVVHLRPDLTDAHCRLGGILEELNDFVGAEACFREALRHDRRCAGAYAGLANLLRGKLPEPDLTAAQDLLASPDLTSSQRAVLQFGLAQVLDARGAFGAAAEHLRHANAIALAESARSGAAYQPDAHDRFVTDMLRVCTPEFFERVRGLGLVTERPVFIFGLPRSGTTLLEQVLASHSRVFGAGELFFAHESFLSLSNVPAFGGPVNEARGLAGCASGGVSGFGLAGSGSLSPGSLSWSSPPDTGCLSGFSTRECWNGMPGRRIARDAATENLAFEGLSLLDRDLISRVGGAHLARLQALHGSAERVTDKMPDNYLYLGLLAALFPQAKFIHCQRDLRDIAVSCWMLNFASIPWSNDQDHIVSRIQQYLRVMEHWRRVLPVSILEISYEETVGDLESVARRLISWCGLEWEPRCLQFHNTSRPVRTASASQVRQPVYQSSLARWKNYASDLAPLFERLEQFG